LRFGIGRFNTANEIDQAIDIVAHAVRRLRNLKSNA
jgi:cysteine sulfinate desulfinase/cysteine desulfurase-like protein